MLPARSVHAASVLHALTPPSALYPEVRKPRRKRMLAPYVQPWVTLPGSAQMKYMCMMSKKKRCLMGTLPASDSLCEEHLKGSNVGASAYHDQRSPRRRQRRNHENNLISSRGLYTYRNGECLTSTKHHKSLIALEGQVK